ncbi:MAG: carboxy-S-adenosyl-L-methionine synthase CmoA [Cardiobacteriaceae bacterium]|nr:carboxy-S-adenosyl-L-methionine synthase CmoA [Cardiobacteriaceae bacterium]
MSGFARDDIYDRPQSVVDFRFDERTAAVFPDMIHRSVPGYATLLQLFAVIGANFVPESGRVYDLGCALGGASIALHRFIPESATITAVDNSPAMVDRFRAYVEGTGILNINVQQADVTTLTFLPANLIVMSFTLQFIPPEARDALLLRIRRTLQTGGALLIAEKTKPDKEHLRQWHESFKAAQGYSQMAIAQKRESLEHVMQTDSYATVEARLRTAGFNHIEPCFRALQFCAWVATV